MCTLKDVDIGKIVLRIIGIKEEHEVLMFALNLASTNKK